MSRKSIISLFAACAIPIHIWSIYNLLNEIPSWALRMSAWDFVGVIAYTQLFALLESLIILLIIIMLGTILLFRTNESRFIAQVTLVILLTSALIIAAHSFDNVLRLWGMKQFLLVLVLFVLLIGFAWKAVGYSGRLQGLILLLVDKLVVLSFVYLFIDLISVFIVIIRNI